MQFIKFVHNASSIYRYNFKLMYSDVTSAPFYLIVMPFTKFVQMYFNVFVQVSAGAYFFSRFCGLASPPSSCHFRLAIPSKRWCLTAPFTCSRC